MKPETVVAWHRQGFRLYWTWKSRRRTGRPTVDTDVRALIQTMAHASPLWGAPRIHGELLKLDQLTLGCRLSLRYSVPPAITKMQVSVRCCSDL